MCSCFKLTFIRTTISFSWSEFLPFFNSSFSFQNRWFYHVPLHYPPLLKSSRLILQLKTFHHISHYDGVVVIWIVSPVCCSFSHYFSTWFDYAFDHHRRQNCNSKTCFMLRRLERDLKLFAAQIKSLEQCQNIARISQTEGQTVIDKLFVLLYNDLVVF